MSWITASDACSYRFLADGTLQVVTMHKDDLLWFWTNYGNVAQKIPTDQDPPTGSRVPVMLAHSGAHPSRELAIAEAERNAWLAARSVSSGDDTTLPAQSFEDGHPERAVPDELGDPAPAVPRPLPETIVESSNT